jgi:cell division protein FtsQ
MNAAAPRPLDVRLMNMTLVVLLLTFAALGALAGVRWLARLSAFDIQGITVVGDTRHSNSITLRANVAPRIAGTFFSVDLSRVRAAFEAVPWVRHAVVQREFPNRLKVTLQEHQPVGLWGSDGDLRLINNFGEVFEANVGEVDQDNLPTLNGPDGRGAEVLGMFHALQPSFAAADLPIAQLELSGRGSWSVKLETGASIELGRGTVEEVQVRTNRLLKTMTQVVSRYGRQASAIESVDLRHENGYAIRLRGISTVLTSTPAKLWN